MTTKNLSAHNPAEIPHALGMKFGIVVSEWNQDITRSLLEGAVKTLLRYDVNEEDIDIRWVPGSFEIPLGAQYFAEEKKVDAILCLGCVIQGETRHFDYICDGVTRGITDLNLKFSKPFIFGILTTNTYQQALDRAGGKHGNKGDETAITAIKMVALRGRMK